MVKQKTCAERVDNHLEERIKEVDHILKCNGRRFKDIYGDDYEDVTDWLNTWALAYEDDPHYRAKKLECSYGEPSDGFRFFEDNTISYYFHDWFDGAERKLYGGDYDTMKQLHEMYLSF